ncbi:Serine/threonine-protein kinase Kist [Phytophthora pseudosyringae]|uniref:Serine/threonine-protein kinase Kist n=1 Tax=Phytophthora pseudosyringae TaxID=221518 RepID=A0A8T1W4Q4_9STRA|nr:Serine/threonine-protein kinase Kist [Phytophthora pseudosyringae]
MGRREEEVESGRRHGRRKASPSPTRGEDNEESIRNKLRESGWKKRRTESESTADAEPSKGKETAKDRADKSPSRPADDHRSARTSRRSRSPRRRDREHRSSRRKSSGSRRRSPSRSRSPASRSRSRSRSAGRRRRRHSSSSRKRRSPSRGRDAREPKRSRRSRSATSASKRKTSLSVDGKKKKEEEKEDEDETETENEEDGKKEDKEDKDEKTDDRHRPSSSRKSSRRSRSGSPRSPLRSSRRRRHHRRNPSRSRSPSRSRRARRAGSRSLSRSPPRDRRSRGRDRRSRRRGRSYSRSPSYSRRRRRNDRSSSRNRPRRDAKGSPDPQQHPPAATAAEAAPPAAATGTAPPAAAPSTGVNPTITQLMAQYPTMSLQDIIAKMQASNVTMAAAVAQKPARELYVGNLPPNVTGPQLQEFLSTIIQQVGLTTQPGNPIVNTWISTDGHFAFCEMRSVEECNLALLLNQLSLLGQPLKFGRPRSFMGPPQPMPQISARAQTALTNLGCTPNPAWFAQPAVPSLAGAITTESATLEEATLSAVAAAQPAAPAVTTTEAGSTHHRLIMSNIPVVLMEDQVKELVEPFGALKSFTLVKDPATGASLGSALFEYEDNDVAAQAVEGLNGLSIGGILLSVQRQPPTSGAALPIAAHNPEDQPSAVLKMANMVSIDELRDDEEYADLAEDVEEECKRFGSVTGMEIPRPKDGEEIPGLGCIYVRFGKEEDAVSALKALNGRKFGGSIVKVTYFPLHKFEKNELS